MEITLEGFLLWLGTVGGSGTVLSFIFEQIEWFQSLSEKGRKWVSFGGMATLGILSHVTLTYVPQDVLLAIAYMSLLLNQTANISRLEKEHSIIGQTIILKK